jgi:hypothetical protein
MVLIGVAMESYLVQCKCSLGLQASTSAITSINNTVPHTCSEVKMLRNLTIGGWTQLMVKGIKHSFKKTDCYYEPKCPTNL